MLKQLIKDLKKYDSREICFKTGVSNSTLYLITSGKNDNPTIKTLEALQDFVDAKKAEEANK